jgi:hypothetical protein
MTPGIDLAIRAYHNRLGAEQTLAIAQNNLDTAKLVFQDALDALKQMREEEQWITEKLDGHEQAEVLQEILRNE